MSTNRSLTNMSRFKTLTVSRSICVCMHNNVTNVRVRSRGEGCPWVPDWIAVDRTPVVVLKAVYLAP